MDPIIEEAVRARISELRASADALEREASAGRTAVAVAEQQRDTALASAAELEALLPSRD